MKFIKYLFIKIYTIKIKKKSNIKHDLILNELNALIIKYDGKVLSRNSRELVFTGSSIFSLSTNPIIGIKNGEIKLIEANDKLYICNTLTMPSLLLFLVWFAFLNLIIFIFSYFDPDIKYNLFFILATFFLLFFQRFLYKFKFRKMISHL